MQSIGIVGAGTVGQALVTAFEGHVKLWINDPKLSDASSPLEAMVACCEAIFIAVPTPSHLSGDADLSVFESVMAELGKINDEIYPTSSDSPVICIKSAVPPDKIASIIRQWPHLRIIVSPEFLREVSPHEDMLNMVSLVLGGDEASCTLICNLFKSHSNVVGPMRISLLPDAIAAAFLKYQENAFLAMKVSFMNEFYDIFSRSNSLATWEQLQTAFHQDHERMGSTHWAVPGPDGLRGWGGRCLPKDVSAFQSYASRIGVKTPLLDATRNRNFFDRERVVEDTAPIETHAQFEPLS
jgi:UDPglucose 6-dehydrogenase